jgi:methyl-accepting chemotaxis protein
VKELARQTAGATEDIRNRIQRIQNTSGDAVRSISDVGEAIRQVNQTSSTIASAVEEQSVITKQIAVRVNQTAHAVSTVSTGVVESATACDEVARNIAGVDQSSKQTAIGANQSHAVATELSKLSEDLRVMVGRFQVA